MAEPAKEPVKETVTFKLDGRDVTVPKGWTVMQAAVKEGVRIPHFCWHPGLEIAGVCRFCMVKVEGRPKLEIACNLVATPGMAVATTTEEVKDAHKWALEFHLVNHPLDCPYCDQAGECGLQDYYMEVGKYQSQMTRPKVMKPKALDVGSELVLDTERCILCSRCVRFEEEVTKTNGLGIFDRGDRSIIGTYQDKKLEHNYQENIVDICPVGAFTSKKFRFKQRVWFLKGKEAVCPGCSTGCHIEVEARPERRRYYRIKPLHMEGVNGYWMCDKGRRTFEHLNPEERLGQCFLRNDRGQLDPTPKADALNALAQKIKSVPRDKVALLVSAQFTVEEYEALFALFVKKLNVTQVFQWREPSEKRDDFDGVLFRGDRNANTKGLLDTLGAVGIKKTVGDEFEKCLLSNAAVVVALSPEIKMFFPSLKEQLAKLAEMPFVSLWSTAREVKEMGFAHLLAMKGFMEKEGHFLNHNGGKGLLKNPFPAISDEVLDVREAMAHLASRLG